MALPVLKLLLQANPQLNPQRSHLCYSRAELANAVPDLYSPDLYNYIAEIFHIQRQKNCFENVPPHANLSLELFLMFEV